MRQSTWQRVVILNVSFDGTQQEFGTIRRFFEHIRFDADPEAPVLEGVG